MKLIGKLHDGAIFTKKGYDEEPFKFKIDEGNNISLFLVHFSNLSLLHVFASMLMFLVFSFSNNF